MSRDRKEPIVPAQPTDQQLAAMIRHLAQLHLEVERGMRPPDQLRPYMTPASYRRLRGQQGVRFRDPSPPSPEDLGPVHLSRPSPDKVLASLRTREQGDQHGALVIELGATREGRWRITELARVGHHLALHGPTPSPVADERTRIRRTEDERSAVKAAYWVEAKRVGELSGPEAERAAALASYWGQRLTELDQELQALRQRHEMREPRELLPDQETNETNDVERHREPGALDNRPRRRASRDRSPESVAEAPHPESSNIVDPSEENAVVRLLGPRPEEGHAHRLWQRASDEIRAYRARWEIADEGLALGSPPDDHDQSHHRARVTDVVRAVRHELGRNDPSGLAPDPPSLDFAL